MLKLKKGLSERLPPLILYFEDIDRIYHLFEEVNPDIKISTADYAFDNLQELKESGIEKTNYFSMHTTEPSISLKLEPYSSTLEWDEDAAKSKATIERIRFIVVRRKRYLTRLLKSGVLAGIVIGFSSWYLIPGLASRDTGKIAIGFITLVVGLLWSWWAIVKSHMVYPTIYLTPGKKR
jgi:hypothetical protein